MVLSSCFIQYLGCSPTAEPVIAEIITPKCDKAQQDTVAEDDTGSVDDTGTVDAPETTLHTSGTWTRRRNPLRLIGFYPQRLMLPVQGIDSRSRPKTMGHERLSRARSMVRSPPVRHRL